MGLREVYQIIGSLPHAIVDAARHVAHEGSPEVGGRGEK